jgi:hypothetical protein
MNATKFVNNSPYVLYEIEIQSLKWQFGNGSELDVTHLLSSGRANYILIEDLISRFSGIGAYSQGGKSDLRDVAGLNYEVKSYRDVAAHPSSDADLFHTASSSTFAANNYGPAVKKMLDNGNYRDALKLCKEKGYNKNEFYVYVNSAQYQIGTALSYVIVPKSDVLRLLSKSDPRLISRRKILGLVTSRVAISGI